MGFCSQCNQPTSFWSRDPLCSQCRREAEEAEIRARREAKEAEIRARRIDQLIFVGLKGYALALDRDTGKIVWSNNQMESGYVTLLLDGDRLIVSTNGYTYCLDPRSGQILWRNPLEGYGTAPTSVISVRGQSSQTLIQQAAEQEAAKRRSAAHVPHAPGA